MFSRVLAVSLLVAAGFPALCQDPQVQPLAPVPYYVLYDEFLFRVTWLEQVANQLVAQGKDDTWARSSIRRGAQLTSEEEAALKAVAADWRQKSDAMTAANRALLAAHALDSSPQAQQDRANLRQQNVLDHVAQLQTAFGPARFKLFDVFVRRTAKVRPPGVAPPAPGVTAK